MFYQKMKEIKWSMMLILDKQLSDDFKHEVVEHHVAYLETMVSQDFWTTEDMTTVNNAITSGNAYTS